MFCKTPKYSSLNTLRYFYENINAVAQYVDKKNFICSLTTLYSMKKCSITCENS